MAAALLGLILLALPLSLVDRLIFQPSPGEDLTPTEVGIQAADVFLETEDGVRVHAYWLPSPGADRAILFLHGNAGNASHRLPNAALLQRLDASVLLMDYRGYGKSDGRPSERGVYADARAGLAHLMRDRGIPEDRIVVFGRSLGGSVAVELARGRQLAGVILESTFTSIRDVARGAVGPLALFAGRRFDSLSKIGEIKSPLLFFHGDHDALVPYVLGRELYQAAPEPKAFETIPGAGHNDTVQRGGLRYLGRIARFLGENAP